MARQANTLFRPWKVLGFSFISLYVAARAYFMYGVEMSSVTRNVLASIAFLFFFGALALLARNVCWRADNAVFYHPLPRWALWPFTALFGYLSVALIVQLVAFFSLDDLLYLALIAVVTTVGIADIVRSRFSRAAA
jgi:hypothetical protein